MVVCICNVIREKEIREAARQGISDVVDVYAHLGCEPNCCQCFSFAEQIIDEECRVAA
ncbi:MAG TPA: (2Fe-2S)-binding protein [Sphingobium sp.]|uniref:(2Fe-2S)-binding protein n=1 Tax=Sphingobium sp. TaxID=1912891 RepID=UPI002ED40E2C